MWRSLRPMRRRSAACTRFTRIAALLEQTAADLVFLTNLDEIGSEMTRRAAFGVMPLLSLHGRLGGIYFRPRFLASFGFSPNLWLKARGFKRLLRDGWFSHLLLPDPYLHAELKARAPQAPAFFLPDFFPGGIPPLIARRRDGSSICPPTGAFFYSYGAGYRRKGLGLAVQAMLSASANAPASLLCAGRHGADRTFAEGLNRLTQQGRARAAFIAMSPTKKKNCYLPPATWRCCPTASIFGSSGVLVRAIGAGLPVIASDEQLIGRLVREHGLGIVFSPGDADALRHAIPTRRASVAGGDGALAGGGAQSGADLDAVRIPRCAAGGFDRALRAASHELTGGAA